MAGRKRKPTALKKLQGNPGKRALPKNEPMPVNKKPFCPRHLNKPAKAEWKRIAGPLHDAGLLTYVDRAVLAAYCQAYGRWVIAESKLNDLGDDDMVQISPKGYQVKSAWLTIADKAMDQMKKLAAEFGLSPSSRASLSVGQEGEEVSLVDELLMAVEMSRQQKEK